MRRLLHLSDLHFGRLHRPALESLRRFIDDRAPSLSLVVVTGDWTQRARPEQFAEARAFLKTVTVPVLSVPGNHDVPLYDFWTRLLRPYDRYEEAIGTLAVDSYMDDEIAVLGLSSVNPLSVADGYLRGRQIREARAFLARVGPTRTKILAIHHPVFDPRERAWLKPGWRSRRLLSGFDLVLSGHGHRSSVREIEAHGRRVLAVDAGSATSDRRRGGANGFHLLEVDGLSTRIETYELGEDGFVVKKEGTPFGVPPLEV